MCLLIHANFQSSSFCRFANFPVDTRSLTRSLFCYTLMYRLCSKRIYFFSVSVLCHRTWNITLRLRYTILRSRLWFSSFCLLGSHVWVQIMTSLVTFCRDYNNLGRHAKFLKAQPLLKLSANSSKAGEETVFFID